MSLGRRCKRVFEQALSDTETITISKTPDPMAVRIVNMVASVHVLHQGESLRIPNIVTKSYGAAKYTPKTFQAMIIRTGDNGPANNVTALVYPNGKMNIVGSVNPEHARFFAQKYRLHIEEADNRDTCFTDFLVYNTVISSHLGFRPNLSKLIKLYPVASEWEPELFPALRLQVWISPKDQCACVKKKHRSSTSCKCNVTCLFFDSGQILLTGLRDYKRATRVCDSLRLFFFDYDDLKDETKELPPHLRWLHRNAQKMAALEVDFIGTHQPLPEPSAASLLEKTVKRGKTGEPNTSSPTLLAPIFEACDSGQVEMVSFLLSINPECASLLDDQQCTPIERVMNRREEYADEGIWLQLVALLSPIDDE